MSLHTDDKQAVYRMGEVRDITRGGRMYKITPKGGQSVDIRLHVAIGSDVKKGVKLSDISESRITEADFAQYAAKLSSQRGFRLLTKKVSYGRELLTLIFITTMN